MTGAIDLRSALVPKQNVEKQSVCQRFEELRSDFQDIKITKCSEKIQALKSRIDAINEGIGQYDLERLKDYRVVYDQEMVLIKTVISSVQQIQVSICELTTRISKSLSAISVEVIGSVGELDGSLAATLQKTAETARTNLSTLRAYSKQIKQLLSDYSQLEGHTFQRLIDNVEAVQNGNSTNSILTKAYRYVASRTYNPGMFQSNSKDDQKG